MPVSFTHTDKGEDIFYMEEDQERVAEMVTRTSDKVLTVYHTEVFPKGAGRGLGKQLLDEMAGYARSYSLQVIPLCPFVRSQFEKHAAQYSDIWKKA